MIANSNYGVNEGLATIACVGRFQPFHTGHFDLVRRVALRDWSILANAADERFLTACDGHNVVVCVVDKRSPRPSNPLTVGERIALIEAAIDHDAELRQLSPPIRVTWIPSGEAAQFHLAYLRRVVPFDGPIYITGANPETRDAAEELGFRWIEAKNRTSPSERSATAVREHIRHGDLASARGLLPIGTFEIMRKRGLFDKIRAAAASEGEWPGEDSPIPARHRTSLDSNPPPVDSLVGAIASAS